MAISPFLPETLWPSGLRRWLKAPVRKGVGSNPTAVKNSNGSTTMANPKGIPQNFKVVF